jgi:hypothetical protein
MVTITCPWCDEDEPIALTLVTEPEAPFTCPDCGTTVDLVEEPASALEPAA